MDLFAIERYNGTEIQPESDPSAAKSSHLQRLLAKIEEKKLKAQQQGSRDLKCLVKKKGVKKDYDAGGGEEFIVISKQNGKAPVKRKRADGVSSKEESGVESETNLKKKKKKKGDEDEEQSRIQKNDEETTELDLDGQFTVLGSDVKGQKKSEVAAVLPYWMENPSLVSSDLSDLKVAVDDLPQLSRDLADKLKKNGVTHFFPVQHEVIPWILESQSKPPQFWPRDVCVCVPTGSGKTFTFVLPIIQALRSRFIPHIRALVVVPVQELAIQVSKVFLDFIDVTDLNVVCLSGVESFEKEQSQLVRYSEADQKYYSRADIVVTTAGRLVDHLQSTPGFTLHYLKYLVIDEADRVIERMHNDWLHHLESHLISIDMQKIPPLTVREMGSRRPPPQKLLFSATLTSDPEKLQKLGLFRPTFFAYGGKHSESSKSSVINLTTPAELSEYWVACDLAAKPLCLYHIILEGDWKNVLVFVNSVENVHRLAVLMRHMFKGQKNKAVAELSSISKKRHKFFNSFASGNSNILVSTDALARGMDFPNLDCVISYDVPTHFRTYIHRAGRSGRAGRQGTAITLVERTAMKQFNKVFSKAGVLDKVEEKVVAPSTLKSSEEEYHKALEALKGKLEYEQKGEKKKNIRDKQKIRGGKLTGRKMLASGLKKKKVSTGIKNTLKEKKITI